MKNPYLIAFFVVTTLGILLNVEAFATNGWIVGWVQRTENHPQYFAIGLFRACVGGTCAHMVTSVREQVTTAFLMMSLISQITAILLALLHLF
uniref:uncharacterized protein LOC120329242 isoform X2 n=1 Tax=Styela clava TaxID=7725 RepID=UPI00193A7DE5|nr:uncharacterized protein LOC120329242 isoform X2 [Styela clava]